MAVDHRDGGSPLTLGAVQVPAGFTLIDGIAGTIAPGGHDTFTVRLDTATAGTRSGTIRRQEAIDALIKTIATMKRMKG